MQLGAYCLGSYSLQLRDLGPYQYSFDWGRTVWRGYSFQLPDLEPSKYPFDRGPTVGGRLQLPGLEPSKYSFDWGLVVWGAKSPATRLGAGRALTVP